MVRYRCGNILQSDKRQGNYFNNNFIYSFYYKGVKIDVGISYSKVEFSYSAYSTPYEIRHCFFSADKSKMVNCV